MSEYNRGGNSPRGPARSAGGASRFGAASPRQSAPVGRSAPPSGSGPRRPAGPNARNGTNGRPPQGRVPAQARPRAAVPAGGATVGIGQKLPQGFGMLTGICAAIIVLGVVLQCAMPEGFPLVESQAQSPLSTQMVTEIHSHGPVRINEIMTANGGVLTDDGNNTPDWVEVMNVSASAMNMKGYVLARKVKASNVFVFPDVVLQPNECAIVYADSAHQAEAGEELHAPFRLSATGDVLMLFNQADVAVDTVNIPALAENAAYVRIGAENWEVSETATPGLPNTEESYRMLTTVSGDSDVQIVELMSSNDSFAPDENGVCHDYVVLKTVSGQGADLSGWYLSDTGQLPRMWRFPDGASIPAGGTLLVHCSGLNRVEDLNHLHTSFKLSSEGEQVLLSNPQGRLMDAVKFDLIQTDNAYIRAADGSWSVGTPTVARAPE